MKFIEQNWLAILAASAWLPYLWERCMQWYRKPQIRVITHREAEIGFTTYGPIFNLRLAFSVKHKDIVVSDLKIRIRHQSGEEKVFEWQGITQQLGKMTAPDFSTLPFEKEQSVLAMKLNLREIEERFIRCQEAVFIERNREHTRKAVEKLVYLKEHQIFDIDNFMREKEMTDLISQTKQAFTWQPGKYNLSIDIQSPDKFDIVDNKREFELTQLNIEELSKNKDSVEQAYRSLILGTQEGDEAVNWQWQYPMFV